MKKTNRFMVTMLSAVTLCTGITGCSYAPGMNYTQSLQESMVLTEEEAEVRNENGTEDMMPGRHGAIFFIHRIPSIMFMEPE